MGDSIKLLILYTILCSLPSHASQDQTFGLGGTSSGRVTSVTAEVDNPYAALYNPALMAAQKAALFSFTSQVASASYAPIKNVLVDSPNFRTQTGTPKTEDYQHPATHLVLWSLGFTYPFGLPWHLNRRAAIGITLSGLFDKLRTFNFKTPYDFYSLRYGTSDAQFKATLSSAIELWPEHLYLGGGASFYISPAGSAEIVVNSDNPTGRLAYDVGLGSAAVLGLLAKHERTTAGLVYRQAVNPSFEQKISGQLEALREPTVEIPLVVRSALYYEPHLFELEVQQDFDVLKASVGMSYQLWSQYKPSFVSVETKEANGQNKSTQMPGVRLKNTLNPRASVEVPTLRRTLFVSGGYQFRPSPVEDLSGSANILDSDTHVLGLSIRYQMAQSEWLPLPLSISLFAQYHWLRSRRADKSDPNFIGAPGYDFNGNAYTYGLTLQAEL